MKEVTPKIEPEEKGEELSEKVGKSALRKITARKERHRSIWFGMGMFGLVGWSVAIPTLLGAALGRWIDQKWPSTYSWTLMLLFFGLALGCLNAWRWVKEESKND